MLEPDSRQVLLEALRPPAGFALETAVGTTYTLDLDALLLVPLAFALFDADADTVDATQLLAAVRETADRVTVFAQAGTTSIPREFRRIAAYLEESVVPVTTPRPGFIFHPKVWVLRYRAPDGRELVRALVLTRNLTFSRSWDALVTLDATGDVVNGAPLATFLDALPRMAVGRAITPRRQAAITSLAEVVRGCAFAPPEPFESVAFHPLGLRGVPGASPLVGRADRWLVISPFLTADFLSSLTKRRDGIIVSRQESLDHVGSVALAGFPERFVLSDHATGDGEGDAERGPADEATGELGLLSGLHAKLFVADAGWDARVIAGSANATTPAWSGNVELVVEMTGKKSKVGIDAILPLVDPTAPRRATLRDLLLPFDPAATPREPSTRELLLRALETAQRAFAAAPGTTTVHGADGDRFDITIELSGPVPDDCVVVVWPISLKHGRHQALVDGATTFQRLTFDAITSFVAVEITMRRDAISEQSRFVVPTTLVDAPADRLERLLTMELGSIDQVMRYLLLLLAPEDAIAALADDDGDGGGIGFGSWAAADTALFEALLRVATRDRSRIDSVERLVRDLQATAKGRRTLPHGLLDIWKPIRDAIHDA